MTLNIFFLTVTIKKRIMTPKEIQQYELIKQIEEENRNRQTTFMHMF